MDAEKQRTASEKEHLARSAAFSAAEARVKALEKKLSRLCNVYYIPNLISILKALVGEIVAILSCPPAYQSIRRIFPCHEAKQILQFSDFLLLSHLSSFSYGTVFCKCFDQRANAIALADIFIIT